MKALKIFSFLLVSLLTLASCIKGIDMLVDYAQKDCQSKKYKAIIIADSLPPHIIVKV